MERVSNWIPKIVKDLDAGEETQPAVAFAAWSQAAGELLSRRTAAVAFVEKRLTIAVPDATWKRHLEDLAPQLLAKINSSLGSNSVKFIEFLIDPESLARKGSHPRTPREREYKVPESLRAAAERISDPELREKFLDAAAGYLSKNKQYGR